MLRQRHTRCSYSERSKTSGSSYGEVPWSYACDFLVREFVSKKYDGYMYFDSNDLFCSCFIRVGVCKASAGKQ